MADLVASQVKRDSVGRIQAAAFVRSMMLPLQGVTLVVPNAAVAEIVRYQDLESFAATADWLLGALAWRERSVPVVSFEAFIGYPYAADVADARIAVFNTLNADAQLPFIGVVTAGLPHLLRVDETSLRPDDTSDVPAGVLRQVRVGEQVTLIPDIDALEAAVKQAS